MSFWTTMYLFWPHALITHVKVYQMCFSSQLTVLNAILNRAASQWSWNCIGNPSQKRSKIYLLHVTITTFPISISTILLWFTMLSFPLQHVWFISLTYFWSYIKLVKLCTTFNHSISIKVIMLWVNIIYWLYIPLIILMK